MTINEIFNLYEKGEISKIEFDGLMLLYKDSKYTYEEAKEKEENYFNKFNVVLSKLSTNQEKARVMFELMVVYNELKEMDCNTDYIKGYLNNIYSSVQNYPEKSSLTPVLCTIVKRILIYSCFEYKIRTGFTVSNQNVFKELVERVQSRIKNDNKDRGTSNERSN